MTGPSGIPLVTETEGHVAPLYPYAERLGAQAILIARCDSVTAVGAVVQIVLEQYGWRVLTTVSGANRFCWVGVALDAFAAKRGRGPNFSKAVGEWGRFQVAGLYEGAELPSTLTPTTSDHIIGYTGGSAALAVSSDEKHEAVFAEAVSATFAAGTTQDLRLFGKPVWR